MDLIEQKSPRHQSAVAAADALAGLKTLDGFVFGYVEPKTHRTVSFHRVDMPVKQLFRGQRLVEAAAAAR